MKSEARAVKAAYIISVWSRQYPCIVVKTISRQYACDAIKAVSMYDDVKAVYMYDDVKAVCMYDAIKAVCMYGCLDDTASFEMMTCNVVWDSEHSDSIQTMAWHAVCALSYLAFTLYRHFS